MASVSTPQKPHRVCLRSLALGDRGDSGPQLARRRRRPSWIGPGKRRRVRNPAIQPQLPEAWRGAAGGRLIRHQPARSLSTRVSRFRALTGVQTVCRQSRGKLSRNEIVKVAARPASARQSSLARRSDRAQISHTKRSPNANLRSVPEAMA